MTIILDPDTGISNATWTTAGRPSSPVAGQRGFNTTLGKMEAYVGTQWRAMSGLFSATGGTIATSGNYTIHTFTSSGTFTPNMAGEVEYLVVAGGGGGGRITYYGSGGGAGGFLTATGFAVAGGAITVTVGAGGIGNPSGGSPYTGENGSNSVFSSITCIGGGGGEKSHQAGNAGGSGGGEGGYNGHATEGGGAGTVGQGNDGGDHVNTATRQAGAGGGGAGSVGGNNSGFNGGAGGAGLQSSIITLLAQVEHKAILVEVMVRTVQAGRMQLTEDMVVGLLLKQTVVQES